MKVQPYFNLAKICHLNLLNGKLMSKAAFFVTVITTTDD